jgi:hypothetical protein
MEGIERYKHKYVFRKIARKKVEEDDQHRFDPANRV